MLVFWLVAVLVTCRVLGGRFSNFSSLRLQALPWLGIAVILQLVSVLVLQQVATGLAGGFMSGTYLILVIIAWRNRHFPGLWLLFIGMLLNFTVIAANGGFMPTTHATLGEIGRSVSSQTGTSEATLVPVPRTKDGVMADPVLLPLGDVLVVPLPGKFSSVLSIGDLFIGAGIAWFCFVVMKVPWPGRTRRNRAVPS